MKILKPGKVEMRRFVCNKCGCVFVSSEYETYPKPYHMVVGTAPLAGCPTCHMGVRWETGEPYEEPTQDLEADRERLRRLIQEWNTNYFGGVNAATEFLLENGVTFREV